MEALLIYIAKSSGLIALFYCAYFFLLRKETFFNSSRWFLLTGLITSIVLPLIVYTKVIWINPASVSNLNFSETNFIQTAENKSFEINWIYLALFVYSIGFTALLIKFAIDFYSLNSVIKGKKIQQQADFKFIDTNENIAPFSYFEYIVYNSSMYTESELENIIEHEKIHSDQNHTIDVLISRAFCMIFWFNPIIWLYRKAITQNLEFIADKEAAEKAADKKAYQYTLLKITTHENCVAITNHFYQSLIKKRIVMLNKNQSKKKNLWKYCVVVPMLAAFVLLFQIETIAKEKQQTVKEISEKIKSVDVYKIRKTSTDAELQEIKEKLKKNHNVDCEISEVKRNSENNLTSIKIDLKNGDQTAQSTQTTGNSTIKDFGVIVITNSNGTKKVGIQTSDEENHKTGVSKSIRKIEINETDDSDSETNSKTAVSNKLTTKTNTNVNTNSSTSTKNNNDSNTSISTTVITNDDNTTTTKIITTKKGSSVAVSNGTKTSTKSSPMLIIVDGEEMPAGYDYNEISPNDIESVNVFTGNTAANKYGDKGKDGVMVIKTHK